MAIRECKNELILCCDATNSLDVNFLRIAITHLIDVPEICSVSGIIKAKKHLGAVCRWRSRHLFKEDIKYSEGQITKTRLVTYGTLVRKSMILQAGNFDPKYKHSEDVKLGEACCVGYKSIGDPALITFSEITNSLSQVLKGTGGGMLVKMKNLIFFLFDIFDGLNPICSGLKSK